ncbi:MAG: hypothetical protein DI556_15415 [Rhodovulum sulfidophilum]|uniref:HTH cro/C1-type domain-containing protein n=1 Tax=Rhodovulum sulfidophilum TaxID=35806 RepID=A0A2W5PTW5_RHOSU|nr:MAG: hypothetical protein DI556_15415 [Rhodovulum sulfidophilum]
MTLQQLADKSGISASMLSLAERGLASPSIGSLIVVSEALGTSMSKLLETSDHTDDLVVRASDVQVVVTPHNVVRRVLKEDRKTGVSIALNEYAPNTASNETPLSHEGFEYGLVLEGSIEVVVDGVSHLLSEGDLISYASQRPHRIRNIGAGVARTVWFNTARP